MTRLGCLLCIPIQDQESGPALSCLSACSYLPSSWLIVSGEFSDPLLFHSRARPLGPTSLAGS